MDIVSKTPAVTPPARNDKTEARTAVQTRRIQTTQKRSHLFHILILTALMLLMALPGLSKLPVIDRDEARFAVASVQMAESGDYVSIRFQDEARNKKPAGSYWAQSAMIKLFSKPGERRIWVQRLPSVFAALIAVLATYWAGIPMVGRKGAFIGASLLAVSGLMVFEAHIAKTDALLVATSALLLASLAHLRQGGGRVFSLLFWAAIGLSIMIKGPVIPALAIITLLTLYIWERGTNASRWTGSLLFWPGPVLCLLIVLPWSVLIWQATDGQFFRDAVGGDFGNKLIGAQEKHGGPPGLYIASLPLAFWPATLLLLPGIAFAIRAVKGKTRSTNPVVRAMRLAVCFIVPYWLILEVVPTKLPNYLLPIYPALALMAGGAAVTLLSTREFVWSRRLSGLLFIISGIAVVAALLLGESIYGPAAQWPYFVGGASIIAILVAGIAFIFGKIRTALTACFLAVCVINPASYHFLLPSLTELRLADRVEEELRNHGVPLPREGGPAFLAFNFTEPSLVYQLGTEIRLGDQIDIEDSPVPGTIVLIDLARPDSEPLAEAFHKVQLCLTEFSKFEGMNYSRGDPVTLQLSEITPCPPQKVSPESIDTQ